MSENNHQPVAPRRKRITSRELIDMIEALLNSLDRRKLKRMADCAGYNVDLHLAVKKRAEELLQELSEKS